MQGVVCLLHFSECVLSAFIGSIMQVPRGVPLTTAPQHTRRPSAQPCLCAEALVIGRERLDCFDLYTLVAIAIIWQP